MSCATAVVSAFGMDKAQSHLSTFKTQICTMIRIAVHGCHGGKLPALEGLG
jgi:hypothetical protein